VGQATCPRLSAYTQEERLMVGLHSAILDKDQKMILKDALFMYVSDLQKRYYSDKVIETPLYLNKMREVEQIVERLHLTELYQ